MSTVLAPAADVTVQSLRTTRGSPRVVATTVGNVAAGDEAQRSYRWDQTSLAAEAVPTVLGSWAYGGRWIEQGVIAGYANQAGSVRKVVVIDLMLGASPIEGQAGDVIQPLGYYGTYNYTTGVDGQGDGMGQRPLQWLPLSMKTINGGTVVGKASFVNGVLVPDAARSLLPGRWEVIEDGFTALNVKQFGYMGVNAENHTYLGQNFRDDQDALEACIAASRPYKGKVQVPESTGFITRRWAYPPAGTEFTVEGIGAAVMRWSGATTAVTPNPADPNSETGNCMVLMRGATPIMRGLTLRVNGLWSIPHGIGCGYLYGESVGTLSECRILDCDIQGETASGNGSMRYGITIDPYAMQNANGENFLIESTVRKTTIACVWIRYSVQPFNTVIDGRGKQALGGFLATPGNDPWGIAVLNDCYPGNLIMRNLDIERSACWLRLRQYMTNITMDGICGEVVKKVIFTTMPGANQAVASYAIQHTRINASSMGTASQGGLEIFSAVDADLFNFTANHPVTFGNVNIEDGFLATPARIGFYENSINAKGCHFTEAWPFHWIGRYGTAAAFRGRLSMDGCTAQDGGGNGISCANLYGAFNGTGTAVLSEVATDVDVTFANVEGGTNYMVELTIVGSANGPTWGTYRVEDADRLTTGFKIRASVAPGAAASGKTITFRWRCYR